MSSTTLAERFEVLSVLAECRFGTLLRAVDRTQQTTVVLRQLRMAATDDELKANLRTQFHREGQFLSKLSHPSLPRLLEFFEADGQFYLVLEPFEVHTMDHVAAHFTEPPGEKLLSRWLKLTAEALEYLHGQDSPVVYRDLRPDSIFVTPQAVIMLVDFSMARLVEASAAGDRTLFKRVGDASYAAPEQFTSAPTAATVDIYALGATMYGLAARKAPASGWDRVFSGVELEPLQNLHPALSPEFCALITDMMHLNPFERPQSAAAVLQRLATLHAPKPEAVSAPASPVSMPVEPRKGGWHVPWLGRKGTATSTVDLAAVPIQRDVASILPEAVARRIDGVCIGRPFKQEILVAVKDASRADIVDAVTQATQLIPTVVQAEARDVDAAFAYIYTAPSSMAQMSWLDWQKKKPTRPYPLRDALSRLGDLSSLPTDGRAMYSELPAAMVEASLATSEQVLEVLEHTYGRPTVTLGDYRAPADVLRLLSQDTCKLFSILPLQVSGDAVVLAMADPWDQDAIAHVEMETELRVDSVTCLKPDLLAAIARNYGTTEVLSAAIQDILGESSGAEGRRGADAADVENEDAPVIKLVNYLLEQGISVRASEIHLEPREHGGTLRYRIDGRLHEFPAPPEHLYSSVVARIKVLSGLDVSETRFPQDGCITRNLGNRTVDFRVSTIPFADGEGIVMRILDKFGVSVDLDALGIPQNQMEIFSRAYKSPHGLILVAGPTGSGKSTTWYATLSRLCTPDVKVISVEDPVEYRLRGMVQSPIREDIGYTFEMGLRAILRHDPDVIMIGEMRDLVSAEIAVRSALTGHLVFSTIHTNDSVQAVTRLIDMGVPDFLVRAVLRCVTSQRLVRRLCKLCRVPTTAEKGLLAELGMPAEALATLPDTVNVYEKGGCEACKGLGYFGRQAIYEVLDAEQPFRNLKAKDPTLQELTDLAMSLGLQTLRASGLLKVLQGDTSLEEIMKITADYTQPADGGGSRQGSSLAGEPIGMPKKTKSSKPSKSTKKSTKTGITAGTTYSFDTTLFKPN